MMMIINNNNNNNNNNGNNNDKKKKKNNNNNISSMMAFLPSSKLQMHCYGHNHVPVKNNICQKHFLCRNNVSHAGQRGKYLCLRQCFLAKIPLQISFSEN